MRPYPTMWAMVCSALLAPVLAGAACDKKPKTTDPKGTVEALDKAAPVDTSPLPGVDVSKLPAPRQEVFFRLAASLSSPCGKAHSLRASVTSDTACKRAPFAAQYVVALLEDEAPESDVRKLYEDKYKQGVAPKSFKLEGVPRTGPADAPVVMVEFYDYGCPSCQNAHPHLKEALAKAGGKAVLYYKQYPLVGKHPDSLSAAQAVLAAEKQGKFAEMHDALFANSPAHKREMVLTYAKKIGVDIPAFTAEYDAAEPRVRADMAEGDSAGVDHTPTLFFQGREYKGPMLAKYLQMWIDEEVAVNR